MDSRWSSAADGIVEELPDAEVNAGKLCGFRESCSGFDEDGGSGPIANGNSMSSIDMIRLTSCVVRAAEKSTVG